MVGAGIVGLSCAYHLLRRGRGVTVVDREGPGAGSSWGNSGLIVPSHSIPLAAPGVISRGLRWLADPASPFYVRPRPSADLVRWLLRFRSAARGGPMERSAAVLASLTLAGVRAWDELVESERIECGYARRGLLALYATDHGMAEGAEEAELLGRLGVPAAVLDRDAVLEIEPAASGEIRGGVHFGADANLDPAAAVSGLARRVEEMGGRIEAGRAVTSIAVSGGAVERVEAGDASYRPREVVLAAGSWSPGIARTVGIRLPVQPAKGYSVTIPSTPDGWRPRIPLMAHEARAALAPIGDGMRMAGTLELTGMDLSINRRRVRAIASGLGRYVPGLAGMQVDPAQVWCGLRPCAPDGLPIIGRPGAVGGLIVATAHAMIGMTLGPITGRLVSQLAMGERPELDLAPVSPNRFG